MRFGVIHDHLSVGRKPWKGAEAGIGIFLPSPSGGGLSGAPVLQLLILTRVFERWMPWAWAR